VNLTSQLLTFSKGGRPVKRTIDLRPVITNAANFALSGSRTTSLMVIDDGLWNADADEGQIGQVVQNIVLNADQAMPDGGIVEITARNVEAPGEGQPLNLAQGRYIEVAIADTGMGIPEKNIGKIFDPYFTTKEKGSGLGLATCYSIIKNHDGVIDVMSEPGMWTRFRIYLPAVTMVTTEDGHAAATTAAAGGKKRVLFMDDEEIVITLAHEMMDAIGHEVETVSSGNEAIEAYVRAKNEGRPFDLVILDLTIKGGMGGEETVKHLREIDPGVIAVVSSGYADCSLLSHYREKGFAASLNKPYTLDALSDCLNSVLK
jgi:two-component system cell cycle sensor histidine kinase/response regulator CckA